MQVMHVFYDGPETSTRGAPVDVRKVTRGGHLARSDADVSRTDSSNARKAAARPATVFAMPAVGVPSFDPSCAGEGAGTPVP